MSKCDTAKTALMVIPCEISRLAGRIKNRSWGWKDVPACQCSQENGNTHVAFLCLYLWILAAATMHPVALFAATIISAVKLKNFIRSKI